MVVEVVRFTPIEKPVSEIIASFLYEHLRDKLGVEGLDFSVPSFPDGVFRKDLREGGKPFHVPQCVSKPEDLPLLARRYGITSDLFNRIDSLTNIEGSFGSGVFHPESFANLSEAEIKLELEAVGRKGLTLNQMIIIRELMRSLTGKVFDQGVWIRLLGTLIDGKTLSVHFENDGNMVYSSNDWGKMKLPYLVTRTWTPALTSVA